MKDSSEKDASHSFKLEALHLNRLPSNHIEIAEKELRDIAGLFEKTGGNLDLQYDVYLSIYLTDQMGECVDQVSKDYGEGRRIPYNPLRNSVVAQGITLSHLARPPLRVSIVFDQDLWTKNDGKSVVTRIYLISHELGHVLRQARDADVAGQRWNDQIMTYAEEVRRAAKIIQDEVAADIIAGKVCKIILQNDRGQSVWLGEIMGPGFLNSAHELLEKLCEFARQDVQTYRITGVGLEKLYPKAGPLVEELLLVLAHTVALFAPIKQMDLLRATLEGIPGFGGYLAEDWDAFLRALDEEDIATAEAEIVRIYEAVLCRAGLRIEDLPDGRLYVHVQKPVTC